MLPSPGGEGNCVNFRASDASMLVWKSSKLTSGRNPCWVGASDSTASGPEKSSASGACRPKLNNEWLFEDEAESMGVPVVEERLVWRCLVGLDISLLLFLKQESPSLSVTGAMRGGHAVRGTGGGGDLESAVATGLAWGWHGLLDW